MVDPNTRTQKRTPVTLKIKFKSETLEQFIERYAVDVSQGGIFIRTKEPLAVGTQMKFEFQLRDASPLIAGEGTVVWTRENDPSRPAIAPGMGVRFDRLADGSQTVLERILAEKAKQAPVRPSIDTSKPPLFTDTPTRVAPAPVTEALLGGGSAGTPRKRPDSYNEHTPLPKPMPFHSDADEFPDEAFEEATKVRALDELVAQTAQDGHATLEDRRGGLPRMDSTLADAPTNTLDRESAPGLPSPPDARPAPKLLDTTPSPRTEAPTITDRPSDLNAAKTRLGMEPARAAAGGPSMRPTAPMPEPPPPPRMPPPPVDLPGAREPRASMSRAAVAAAEPAQSQPLPSARGPSIAPIVIGVLVGIAAIGAAVWFLILREDDSGGTTKKDTKDKGSAVADKGSDKGSSAVPDKGSSAVPDKGSAVEHPGSGSPDKGSAAVKADLVETVVASSVAGAKIEIAEANLTGDAPFKAKLEKGKAYKAHVTAPGYMPLDVDVTGGGDQVTAKLVAKPRIITFASDPPGAQIYIESGYTGKQTPADVELTKAQAAKPKVRVALRRPGYHGYDAVIDASKFVEDDKRMVAGVDTKMSRAPVVIENHNPTGSGSATPTGSGSAGSDTSPGSDSGSAGSAATPPPPPPPPAGSNAGTGSGEPEPDWTKRQ